MEKEIASLGPANINQLLKGINEKKIRKEDIVQFVPVSNGYILIYYK